MKHILKDVRGVSDLDGIETAVLPGELQQRDQCLQQEGGSACLQNETSLGDKHATLTAEGNNDRTGGSHISPEITSAYHGVNLGHNDQ